MEDFSKNQMSAGCMVRGQVMTASQRLRCGCHVCPLALYQSTKSMTQRVPSNALGDSRTLRRWPDMIFHSSSGPIRLLPLLVETAEDVIGILIEWTDASPSQHHFCESWV